MVNPNDPAAIPYVISEDDGAFWYVAYKEKNPGVPYITVSAKGVANGLSTEYNDGYDFGPDSYNPNISSGIPLTQTAGIQEAWNYAVSTVIPYPSGSIRNNFIPKIVLAHGIFYISQPIILTAPFAVDNLNIEGQGMMPTYVGTTSDFPTTENMITIDPNILQASNFTFKDMQFFGNCNTYLYADFSGYSPYYNVGQLENVDIAQPNNGTYSVYLNALAELYANNFEDYSIQGAYFNGTRSAYINSPYLGAFKLTVSGFSYVNIPMATNNQQLNSDFGIQLLLADIDTITIGILKPFTSAGIYANGNVHNIDIRQLMSSFNAVLFNSQISTPVTIDNIHIGTLNVNNNSTLTFKGSDPYLSIGYIDIDLINVESGSTLSSFPLQSTTDGTTAGTVFMNGVKYTPLYKKYIIQFSGYENDTTTNQAINYPLPFSSYAVISANNTGLTISASTSGITITAPDSTTTYSGIVIVEGY